MTRIELFILPNTSGGLRLLRARLFDAGGGLRKLRAQLFGVSRGLRLLRARLFGAGGGLRKLRARLFDASGGLLSPLSRAYPSKRLGRSAVGSAAVAVWRQALPDLSAVRRLAFSPVTFSQRPPRPLATPPKWRGIVRIAYRICFALW